MSSHTPDDVKVAAQAITDSITDIKDGTDSFSKVSISNTASTTAALTAFTGVSSLSGTADLTLTLAAGAAASFTTVGAIRVSIVDSGGNITDGSYYIPFGTLA